MIPELAINVRQPFASLIAVGCKFALRGPRSEKIKPNTKYGIYASSRWLIRNPIAYRDMLDDHDIADGLQNQHPLPVSLIIAVVEVLEFFPKLRLAPKRLKENLETYSCFREEESVYELKLIDTCQIAPKKKFLDFVFPIIT